MALILGSRENRSFRARVSAPERRSPVLVGLEHEFSVRRAEEPVDFEALLGGLPAPGVRLDPGDPNAHRCSWGGVITADAMEAEIACPPVEAAPGFTTHLTRWADAGASYLSEVLPEDVEAFGYSTHLSISVPTRSAVRAADVYSKRFAPAVMLMLDGPLSPGLRVRSRPSRVELCGEFARGDRLRAAATFALGSVRASAHATRTLHPKRRLPPAIQAERVRTYERPGWYLARTSFGADLYRYCRTTRLTRVGGGTISAQDHLELSWSSARRELEGLATTDELRLVDDLVGGALPLGPEGELPPGLQDAPVDQMSSVFGDAIRPRHRPRFEVKVIAATWDWHLFRVAGVRDVYACIPRDALGSFLEQLDAGDLDVALLRYMGGPDRGRVLSHPRQTLRAGLYDRIGSLQDLLRSEIGGLTWGRSAKGRAGKRNRPVVIPRRRRWPGRTGTTHPGSGRERERDRKRRVRILRWSLTRSALWIAGLATAGVVGTGGYLLASGGSSPEAGPGTEQPRAESSPSAGASPSAAAPSPQVVFQFPWDRLSEALRLTEQPLISDDAADDAIESARGKDPTFFTSEADIAGFSGVTATLDARALKDFPACGKSRDDVATVCSSDAPFKPGRYVIVAGTMRSPVSIDSPNFAVYAAVFDSNGRAGDNFEPDPAFPNDFFQGTDHWIQLVRSPQAGLNLSVMEPEAPTGDFNARAFIWRESVIFIEPLSEFDIELPSFRIAAFINKGDFTPDSKRGGDVAPGLPGPWELEPLQVAAQTEAPEPEEPTSPEPTVETVRQFVKVFNEARKEMAAGFLLRRLHPEVIDLYGGGMCRAYLDATLQRPLRIEVKSVGELEPWDWKVDGRSTRIKMVYPVRARVVTPDGTQATEVHFALTGNHLSWFTDCGEPRN